MGLNYSIRSYIKKEKISNCLNWLYDNSWVYDNIPFQLIIGGQEVKIKGDSFQADDRKSKYIDKSEVVRHFDNLFFVTSLIFDIDPKIIASIPGWELDYNSDFLEDFKEEFEQLYLGNGKIRIGGFDTNITFLKSSNAYRIDFVAVTSDMSQMLENSISVRKWILDFSQNSDSIITLLDLEYSGHKILYYRGERINITIKDGFEKNHSRLFSGFLSDYYGLEYDTIN